MGVVIIKRCSSSSSGDFGLYIDGSLEYLETPQDIVRIAPYKFYEKTSLKSVKITNNVQEIGGFAFYNCTMVTDWDICNCLTTVGNYAFSGSGGEMFLDFNSGTNTFTRVDSGGFDNCLIRSIRGNLINIGPSAFSYNTDRSISVDVKINGSIGGGAFRNSMFTSFHLDKNSVITSIGNESFGFCRNNTGSEMVFDFRASSFSTIPEQAFVGNPNPDSTLKFVSFYFPNSLLSINGNQVFYYHFNCNYYFLSSTPCTILRNTFNYVYNSNIFVPYNSINAYKTATNWLYYDAYIKGWAPENTFSAGDPLPVVNQEGITLTWYTDRECTNQISVVSNPGVELYCVGS